MVCKFFFRIQEPLLRQVSDDSSAPAEATTTTTTDASESTWRNIRRKIKMILPFMWPKGNALLQLVVLFCVLLLVAGRVVNLYTPIMYKKIGKCYKSTQIQCSVVILYSQYLLYFSVDSLTYSHNSSSCLTVNRDGKGQVEKLQFRWDYILIYVLLRFLQGGGAGMKRLHTINFSFIVLLFENFYFFRSRDNGFSQQSPFFSLDLGWTVHNTRGVRGSVFTLARALPALAPVEKNRRSPSYHGPRDLQHRQSSEVTKFSSIFE